MTRPYELTMGHQMAGQIRAQSQVLAERTAVALPQELREPGDAHRTGRLEGLCDGLMGNLAQERSIEAAIGEIRQASGNSMQFRQALFMLMKMHGLTDPVRLALMDRAMAWYRARAQIEGQAALPWAKSFVQIAEANAGKWF